MNPKFQEQIYASQVAGVIGHGRKTVAANGTAEALASDTPCRSVIITALSGNTGNICVGASGVKAASGATRTGIPLAANQSCSIGIDNLAKVFIDATVIGEGVSYAYLL